MTFDPLRPTDPATIPGSSLNPDSQDGSLPPTTFSQKPMPPRRGFSRWGRLCRKELREILRDRRTIVTLILMPLLVYPLLSLVLNRFLTSTLRPGTDQSVRVGFQSMDSAERFRNLLLTGDEIMTRRGGSTEDFQTLAKDWSPSITEGSLQDAVRDGVIDVGVTEITSTNPRIPPSWNLVRRPGSVLGESTCEIFEKRLNAINQSVIDELLRRQGLPPQLPAQVEVTFVKPSTPGGVSLAAFLPLMLLLMTITGAVYPAIDLTAGERERGTLEALIAAPISRVHLLAAKYVAVVFVALLTAMANLTAMTVTLYVTGLESLAFGEAGLSGAVIARVFLALILFSAFFAAILLAITSMARSFKEAQAYLIPLMLATLGPGIVSLSPDIELTLTWAAIPLVNMVLLARDLFAGIPTTAPAIVAVTSTIVYAIIALSIAARIFGTDAVLYGGSVGWRDAWHRPQSSREVASSGTIAATLAATFLGFFISIGIASRLPLSPSFRLAAVGLLGLVVFAGIPLAIASWKRVRWETGFGLRRASLGAWLIAIAMSLSAWTVAHELVLLTEQWGWFDLEAMASQVKDRVAAWRDSGPWLLILTLGIAQPIAEELTFRGLLFQSALAKRGPWFAILSSAIVFGLFHVVGGAQATPERLLPSTFMGLILGVLAWRCGSTLPGMALHAIHNSALLLIAFYQPQLQDLGIGLEQTAHLPASWLIVAGTVLTVSLALSWRLRQCQTTIDQSQIQNI